MISSSESFETPGESIFDWNHVRWVSNFFGRGSLGGIDVVTAGDKGTNGSIAPKKTLNVFKALHKASEFNTGTPSLPAFFDAGIAEGRAALYWASYYRQVSGLKANCVDVYGIEQPHFSDYDKIHRSAEQKATEVLGCPVNIHVVWKKCEDMRTLRSEFGFLSTTASVVYSFWTTWHAHAKEALLVLVAAEPNVQALAVYVTSRDRDVKGQPFDEGSILKTLCQHSAFSTWRIFEIIQRCRFISGAETARAVIFQRVKSGVKPKQTPEHFAFLDDDGYVDMCLDCGGGTGGYDWHTPIHFVLYCIRIMILPFVSKKYINSQHLCSRF